jgi:hypothetical protein
VIVTLLTSGYAYACIYNPPQYLDCLNIEFTQAVTLDNEGSQNVAKIYAQISPDRHNINVQIRNAYPDYQGQLKYVIKNTGNKPVEFNAPTIINGHPEAFQIITSSHENQILQPYQTLQGTLTVLILPDAQQNTQYTFQIKNTATPYKPQPNPQPASYWKQQIQTCQNNPSQAEITPSTLKSYLTEISQQSNAFNFKGTQNQIFQQALNILNPQKQTSENTLKQQLLALWLNQQADQTDGLKIDGKTVMQIIQGSENVLQAHQSSRYSSYASQCERFNNL